MTDFTIYGPAVIKHDGTDIGKTNGGGTVSPLIRTTNPLANTYIVEEIKYETKEKIKEYHHLVLDVPLLFETGLENIVDVTWVVVCSHEKQIERITKRDDLSRKEAQKRISAQMEISQKIKLADFVIYNNGTKEELNNKVIRKWKKVNNIII